MVQNIIDDDICLYTVDIMAKMGIKGDVEYVTKNHNRYWLLKNFFSKHPIKLLPRDILSNLPMADCVGSIIHELAEYNARLRHIVNKNIAHIWLETTKAERKEMLLSL